MDPIAKAKMVALKGIKKVLSQDPLGVPPGMNRYYFLSFTHLRRQYKKQCYVFKFEVKMLKSYFFLVPLVCVLIIL